MRIDIPDYVLEIVSKLENGYVVGGCVRDCILGKEPKDWDICSSLTPQEVMDIFPNSLPVGLKYGSVGVFSEGRVVEVTTFRGESGYIDHRHPQNIVFSNDIHEDLRRRDITINAMAYNHKDGLIDDFGGLDDLMSGVIRCVGEPKERIAEDALRIVRILRFCATLGFDIHQETYEAIKNNIALLKYISTQRIRNELTKLLCGEFAPKVIELDVFREILPQAKNLSIIGRLKRNLVLILAGIFDDIDGVVALEFDKKTQDRVKKIIKYKFVKIPASKIDIKRILRDVGYESFLAILEVKKAMGEDVGSISKLLNEVMILDECFEIKSLAIGGSELKELGFCGAEIGKKLEYLLEMVITQRVQNSREALLNLLKN